jgi:chemotaxis protein MotB
MKENKVIRKIIRRGHSEAHHGGSWKVAYADFVTAMMAFFLLMWLLTMVSAEKRVKLANYFKDFSLFEQGGTPIDTSKSISSSFSIMEQSSQNSSNEARGYVKKPPETATIEQIQEKLEKAIQTRLADLKDQILVDTFKGGVRIQVVDNEGKSMFLLGSSELTDNSKKALSVIAENIKNLGNKMAIGGHTDSLSYSSNQYTNWELSTERASAARAFLENNGVETKRLIMVAGYADVEPLVREDPYDPRNRRISILLFDNPSTQSSAKQPVSAEKKPVDPVIDHSIPQAPTVKKPENPVSSGFQN